MRGTFHRRGDGPTQRARAGWRLIKGIAKFQKQVYQSKKELFEQPALGQKPHSLLITCSDSRIQPDVITGTEPGELFILRDIGNIVPPHGTGEGGAEAVVEYATVALGVHDIIVCGHSHCGAMKAMSSPSTSVRSRWSPPG